MRTWCPRCDQGWVGKFRHKTTNEIIFICEECEALWAENDQIKSDQFTDFYAYFTAKNQPLGWEAVEELKTTE